MYQRSNSSAKEVHRGRQQKRISRQPLQSSSSSAAAAAAAVAAAGAEAAWRGLDRVRELRWQTIERWLRDGHAADIRVREIDVSIGALGWQERDEDMGGWTRCGWSNYIMV